MMLVDAGGCSGHFVGLTFYLNFPICDLTSHGGSQGHQEAIAPCCIDSEAALKQYRKCSHYYPKIKCPVYLADIKSKTT